MYYLGVDLGGTNIKAALVDADGAIIKEASTPTKLPRPAEAVCDDIAALCNQLAQGQLVAGIGIGCPGTVDDRAGTVVYACNIGWVNYDVRRVLEDTGFSVRLVNDANAAALAEAAVGAAKGARSAVVVTLGTGIGGGVVLDGHLLTGFTGAASELGHMCVVADGESCACGRRGCWETYASATALICRTEAAMAAHPDSALHRIAREKGGVDGRTAFAGQEAGDPAATRVVAEYIRYLGVGIANLVNIFFPEVIALGGGIANQGETLLRPLRAQVQSQEYGSAYTKKHPRIVTCTLGSDAGVIGAALFAAEKPE